MEKTFLGQILVFLCLWRQHPFLHKTKGPTRNPISPTPPPLLRRASMSPPPPPESNFQVAHDVCYILRGIDTAGAFARSLKD